MNENLYRLLTRHINGKLKPNKILILEKKIQLHPYYKEIYNGIEIIKNELNKDQSLADYMHEKKRDLKVLIFKKE